MLKRLIRDLNASWLELSVLTSIVLLRILSFGYLAISDPTESRYADIARRMYQTGDWLTPRLYIQGELIPYWGKPPLHFWLTSISYHFFGVSEWSSRFPSIVGGILILSITFLIARFIWNTSVALISAIILSSSGLFFVLWGSAVVDVTLALFLSFAMVAFSMAVIRREQFSGRLWGILFFVALAFGTLTKGLVAPGLAAFSIGIWWLTAFKRQSLKPFPWITGALVYLVITVPWYLLEEVATPGFLKYFIVNEHLLRFLTHDYGDRYGSGHLYPRGTVWVMLVVTFLPWTIFLFSALRLKIKNRKLNLSMHREKVWGSYFLIWGLAPALFFTFSRQLLATYLLPGFSGLAIATAVALVNWKPEWKISSHRRLMTSMSLAIPLVIVLATFSLGVTYDEQHSTKSLFATLTAGRSGARNGNLILFFPFFEPASADFYEDSYKSLSLIHKNPSSVSGLATKQEEVFILRTKQRKNLSPVLGKNLALVGTYGKWSVYEEKKFKDHLLPQRPSDP